MSSKYGFGLVRLARLSRRQLIAFALVSAVVNGIVTALVGAWLAQTYNGYHSRRQSVESIASLFYARRTRAGMVVSALRRNADEQEVRDRKRAYDEAYVEWNTNIRRNLFVIREVMGAKELANLEQVFEDSLVGALADMDRCLTKAYDERMAARSPLPVLEACRMPEVYQFALDCGAAFTNELHKMSQLTFLPFTVSKDALTKAEMRVKRDCTRPAAASKPPPPAQPAPPQATLPETPKPDETPKPADSKAAAEPAAAPEAPAPAAPGPEQPAAPKADATPQPSY